MIKNIQKLSSLSLQSNKICLKSRHQLNKLQQNLSYDYITSYQFQSLNQNKVFQPQQQPCQKLNYKVVYSFGKKKKKSKKNLPPEKKEVLDFSKKDYNEMQEDRLDRSNVKCLVIHPIFHPNKGPEGELYLAEEAIGLTKSLGWGVAKGPFWKQEYSDKIQDQMQQVIDEKERESSIEEFSKWAVENELSQEEFKEEYEKRFGENPEKQDEEDDWVKFGNSELKDGDYVYTPAFKGVVSNGGMVLDLSDTDDSDGGDMFNEWNNQLVRQSLGKSCMMKVRKINSKNFLTRGKIHELGCFIRDNNINALYINSELTTLQNRNLEKILVSVVNGEEDKNFFRKSHLQYKNQGHSSDSELSDSQLNPEHHQNYVEQFERQLKVFDRYTMILQIFAKRAKTTIAKLQIEATFLMFLKSKLMREGGNTFSYMYNIFQGDLMQAEQIKLEVVSAKQKMSKGVMTGGGETQLELERRLIGEKYAEVQKKLKQQLYLQENNRNKRQQQLNNTPVIALIGYTNVGKSALMNQITRADSVESKDLLFQTLSTVSRKIRLVSGQQAILLDTIGFITNLPHELVDSFKSTLQEVEYADLVLHVRDISHPQAAEQKKTVLKVLKQLNFSQEFYTQKMVEVWNKIDLIEETVDYDDASIQDYPVIPISAKYNTNLDKLIEVMEEKVNVIKQKQYYTFKHGVEVHGDRIQWLFKNGNVQKVSNEVYDYEAVSKEFPYGTVEFKVLLDEASFRRFSLHFGLIDKQQEKLAKKSGLPPQGW